VLAAATARGRRGGTPTAWIPAQVTYAIASCYTLCGPKAVLPRRLDCLGWPGDTGRLRNLL
jgi:hypothetical protein